jgi:hypothetical protein
VRAGELDKMHGFLHNGGTTSLVVAPGRRRGKMRAKNATKRIRTHWKWGLVALLALGVATVLAIRPGLSPPVLVRGT